MGNTFQRWRSAPSRHADDSTPPAATTATAESVAGSATADPAEAELAQMLTEVFPKQFAEYMMLRGALQSSKLGTQSEVNAIRDFIAFLNFGDNEVFIASSDYMRESIINTAYNLIDWLATEGCPHNVDDRETLHRQINTLIRKLSPELLTVASPMPVISTPVAENVAAEAAVARSPVAAESSPVAAESSPVVEDDSSDDDEPVVEKTSQAPEEKRDKRSKRDKRKKKRDKQKERATQAAQNN